MPRPLDPVLDLVDEDVGDLVLVAAEQGLRQVVVGVDPRREDDLEAALVGDPLAEGGIAVEEHGARLDHGCDPVALDRPGVGDGGVPFLLVVVEVRELEPHGLVGVRKCSWMRVRPSSSTSIGPLTVSTAAIWLSPVVAVRRT